MSTRSANTTAEIVQFPRANYYDVTRDPSEIQERLYDMKIQSVDDALEFISPTLLEAIGSAGFSLDPFKSVLLIDLMRAMMYEHFCIKHPLNDFIAKYTDEINTIIDYDDEVKENE